MRIKAGQVQRGEREKRAKTTKKERERENKIEK